MTGTVCTGASALTTCSISQTLTTTAGQYYDLSFWEAELDGPTSQFRVVWNGVDVATVTNPNNNSCGFDYINFEYHCGGWLQFSYANLLATSNTTTLEIFGRKDPGVMFFDDFDVHTSSVETPAVPEPASMTLLGTGVAALVARRRRRAV